MEENCARNNSRTVAFNLKRKEAIGFSQILGRNDRHPEEAKRKESQIWNCTSSVSNLT